MLNIGVLVSGGGTNLQKLIDAQAAGQIKNGRLRVVIASRPDAYAWSGRKRPASRPSPCGGRITRTWTPTVRPSSTL